MVERLENYLKRIETLSSVTAVITIETSKGEGIILQTARYYWFVGECYKSIIDATRPEIVKGIQ